MDRVSHAARAQAGPEHVEPDLLPRQQRADRPSPSPSATQSISSRQLRVVEIRNDIGVMNSIAALKSGGSEVARKKPITVPRWAAIMKVNPSPFANAMRCSRGIAGRSRSASIHMLTAVRCAGSSNARVGVSGRRIIGSSDITIGISRTLLSPTAIATSSGAAPTPSDEIRITCAGPAQTRKVEAMTHQTLKPRSCASAAIPT